MWQSRLGCGWVYRCWEEGSNVLDVAGCTGVGDERCSSNVLECSWVYRFCDEGSNVLDVAGCPGVGRSGEAVTFGLWLGVQVLGTSGVAVTSWMWLGNRCVGTMRQQ